MYIFFCHIYIYIYISEVGGEFSQEIVPFRVVCASSRLDVTWDPGHFVGLALFLFSFCPGLFTFPVWVS